LPPWQLPSSKNKIPRLCRTPDSLDRHPAAPNWFPSSAAAPANPADRPIPSRCHPSHLSAMEQRPNWSRPFLRRPHSRQKSPTQVQLCPVRMLPVLRSTAWPQPLVNRSADLLSTDGTSSAQLLCRASPLAPAPATLAIRRSCPVPKRLPLSLLPTPCRSRASD